MIHIEQMLQSNISNELILIKCVIVYSDGSTGFIICISLEFSS